MSAGEINNTGAWINFFRGGLYGVNYIILMHRSDGSLTPSIIPGMQIIDHIPEAINAWGKFSLLKVAKNLFQAACINQNVLKCMLLSGDSIPLCPFNEVYNQAINVGEPETGTLGLSPLELNDDGELRLRNSTHRRRETSVNRKAWPEGWSWPWQWQHHSQWVILPRRHIQALINHFHVLRGVFENSEIPDEHALGVFFHGLGMLDTLRNPHFMFADWDTIEDDENVLPFETCPECQTEHGKMGTNPRTRRGVEITPAFVAEIRRHDRQHFTMFRKVCPRSPVQYNAPWLRNYKCNGEACRDNLNRFPYIYFQSHGEGGRGGVDRELLCPECDENALSNLDYKRNCGCVRCQAMNQTSNVIQGEEEKDEN